MNFYERLLLLMDLPLCAGCNHSTQSQCDNGNPVIDILECDGFPDCVIFVCSYQPPDLLDRNNASKKNFEY